ncbi:MAG: nucleotidyltransferase family protein [Wenzhouxiangella sp.]|nr:nucleotidyltransferase family protein [Wenzhouxiangella sp.]MCH8478300.1 NTP transferase domain-containing protein [Wenzhouxiangella sp.]TVR98512.1 MAG: hypothetical protein EA418_01305 [Wenzhouxiangellaceae bacterium]
MSGLDVILLAGDRGPDDPLAQAAGVAGKTLVPIAGTAMLTRVLRALARWPQLGRVFVLAPDSPAYHAAIAAAGIDQHQCLHLAPEASPSQSVGKALVAAGEARPLLITTADHVLLDPVWLDSLLAAASQAELLVGLVDYDRVMQRFPNSRRTRYRFSDVSVCGSNLFLLSSAAADRVVQRWREVEKERKRPWKIISMLGWVNLGLYLAGRLSLRSAFKALSAGMGVKIGAVIIDDPLAAVDVDTAADLALVEQALAAGNDRC